MKCRLGKINCYTVYPSCAHELENVSLKWATSLKGNGSEKVSLSLFDPPPFLIPLLAFSYLGVVKSRSVKLLIYPFSLSLFPSLPAP